MLIDLEPYLPFTAFAVLYTLIFGALFIAAANRSK